MSVQIVVIYGVRCTLSKTGGGALTRYVVTSPSGAVLARNVARFMAVAEAGRALLERNERAAHA